MVFLDAADCAFTVFKVLSSAVDFVFSVFISSTFLRFPPPRPTTVVKVVKVARNSAFIFVLLGFFTSYIFLPLLTDFPVRPFAVSLGLPSPHSALESGGEEFVLSHRSVQTATANVRKHLSSAPET